MNLGKENVSKVEMGKESIASCLLQESCMLKVPVGKLWDSVKEFKWEKLAPSCIKSLKFTRGSPMELGAEYEMVMIDGSSYTFRIVELSEVKRKFTVEMIECEPKQKFSSMLSSFKMEKVSDDNSTYLCWQTIYSNDVTQDILKERKNLMKAYFKDLKKLEQ
jgi:hypothetical protein